MPDTYNLEIRRINEGDISTSFHSNDRLFDLANPSKTLKEYWESDNQCEGGSFCTYLLVESKVKRVIGIIRLRCEMQGANPNINEKVPEIEGKPSIYLSRLAILPGMRSYHLGRILMEYFFFMAKQEILKYSQKEAVGYLKCLKNDTIIGYYKSFGASVVKEYTGNWGPAVIMSTKITVEE
jgi:hypothetical protein